MKKLEVYTQGYHPDEIDDFLQKEFGIIAGSSAAQKCLEYNVARKVAEKLWKYKEPVSKELEEAAFDYAEACKYDGGDKLLCVEHFKAGAKWQKQQMMKDAVTLNVTNEFSDNNPEDCVFVIKGKELLEKKYNIGDKVKLLIVKEDEV